MGKAKKTSTAKHNGADGLGDLLRTPAAIGHHIRSWRLFKGIKHQKDLARLTKRKDPAGVGLTRSTIIRLENGDTRYNQEHLHILGVTLGVAPRDLIGTDPFDSGDIFALYAGMSASDKARALKALGKFKR